MKSFANLRPGDPAPLFSQRSGANPRFVFDTAAGRYIVLCFWGTLGDEHGRAALEAVQARPDIFNDVRASFFGVSADPRDEAEGRVAERYPGYRVFWDFDLTVAKLYGAAPREAKVEDGRCELWRLWFVLDPMLRVVRVVPFSPDQSDIAAVLAELEALPPPARFAGVELQAPILYLPNVFEPEFCSRLIALWEADGGEESGFMREENGRTVLRQDFAHKRRRDVIVADPEVIAQARARVRRRIVPEIAKAFQFNVTRMERHLVACYSSEDGGHFRPHRDNTTKGTAHRRFAVSINLNDDFEGGEIRFPEYGPRAYKPPPGGAVVFSCGLLHAVSKVTAGRRFAFLPFLYDDAAAKLREENNQFLDESVGLYASGLSD